MLKYGIFFSPFTGNKTNCVEFLISPARIFPARQLFLAVKTNHTLKTFIVTENCSTLKVQSVKQEVGSSIYNAGVLQGFIVTPFFQFKNKKKKANFLLKV